MDQLNYEYVEPMADSVVQSLRSIGYSLETALADVIDNSITAKANKIDVTFHWNKEQAFIKVVDNGIGMSEPELVNAMRIGSRNPLEMRHQKDLGRFGMGLKTASFSQCKRLSVLSKKDNQHNFRCWDLDLIQEKNQWALLKHPIHLTTQLYLENSLENETSGTVVLWEVLDRVLPTESYTSKSYNAFLRKIDQVEQYLCLVFHRFMVGPRAIKISINGVPLTPWDPFLVAENATQELPVEQFTDGEQLITIHPYVLPHQSKLTEEIYNKSAGFRGWNDMQGFYIYRNKRLLVAGSWLGLFPKEEPYKLARVMIDITSNADFKWQIDIKKSKARPPENLIEPLKKIAYGVREKSYRIFYHRGVLINKSLRAEKMTYLWEQVLRRGIVFHRINRKHPLLQYLLEEGGPYNAMLQTYLSMLEEAAPSNQIILSASNVHQDVENFEEENYVAPEHDTVKALITDIVYALEISGMSRNEIIDYLKSTQPFKRFPELISSINLRGEREHANL